MTSYLKNDPNKAKNLLGVLGTKSLSSYGSDNLPEKPRTVSISNVNYESLDATYFGGDATYDGAGLNELGYSLSEDATFWGGGQLYVGTVNVRATLHMRSNVVNVVIPFLYSNMSGGAFIPDDFSTSTGYIAKQFNVVGPAVGVFGNQFQTANLYNPGGSGSMNPVHGNSDGQMVETRMRSYTSNGQFKFTAQGEGVGAEVGGGVTIVSQLASTTLYNYSLDFNIRNNIGSGFQRPTITYTYAVYSTGIQSN